MGVGAGSLDFMIGMSFEGCPLTVPIPITPTVFQSKQVQKHDFWTKHYVFGLIWKLMGMAFMTHTSTCAYPYLLPIQIKKPMTFPNYFSLITGSKPLNKEINQII